MRDLYSNDVATAAYLAQGNSWPFEDCPGAREIEPETDVRVSYHPVPYDPDDDRPF